MDAAESLDGLDHPTPTEDVVGPDGPDPRAVDQELAS